MRWSTAATETSKNQASSRLTDQDSPRPLLCWCATGRQHRSNQGGRGAGLEGSPSSAQARRDHNICHFLYHPLVDVGLKAIPRRPTHWRHEQPVVERHGLACETQRRTQRHWPSLHHHDHHVQHESEVFMTPFLQKKSEKAREKKTRVKALC